MKIEAVNRCDSKILCWNQKTVVFVQSHLLTTMEARTVAKRASLKETCRNMLDHSDQSAKKSRVITP